MRTELSSCCHVLLSGSFCAILTHRALDLLGRDIILRAENNVANPAENSFEYELTLIPYLFELVFLYCGSSPLKRGEISTELLTMANVQQAEAKREKIMGKRFPHIGHIFKEILLALSSY